MAQPAAPALQQPIPYGAVPLNPMVSIGFTEAHYELALYGGTVYIFIRSY